ncbi:hypothetical protein CA13_59540 [Planctomycetes bacterium CA13]|uniref:DUF4272 domain-containing protein n=1 Tax=Novipirellula herctigrandis TaxID=2527986 RepID=A0A5C5ZBE0_9BACT|nr:hypothetical protein CA13_59540 [Planctomycetes bacterium CA13]
MSILMNAYCTVRDPIALTFDTESLSYRDRSDPEVGDHLDGFIGFIMEGGKREMTQSLYAVMRHIERVKHHFSFVVSESQLEQVAGWAWENNAILFYPDSSVRDPAGNVLVDPTTGEPDEEAQIPYPPDSRERKLRSEVMLRNRLIDTPDTLPPVVGASELELRDADEVAWRTLALFMAAVRAESLASENPIPVEKLRAKSPMAFEALSPAEAAFLGTESPNPQTVFNFVWRYEALFTLQWALGLHNDMPFADAICDVPLVAQLQIAQPNRERISNAKLRPAGEILDALDLNYRLLWAAREAQQQKREAPASIDGGVLSERQHALNWLVQFQNADWDEIDIPS